jgi:hypothetical protein
MLLVNINSQSNLEIHIGSQFDTLHVKEKRGLSRYKTQRSVQASATCKTAPTGAATSYFFIFLMVTANIGMANLERLITFLIL